MSSRRPRYSPSDSLRSRSSSLSSSGTNSNSSSNSSRKHSSTSTPNSQNDDLRRHHHHGQGHYQVDHEHPNHFANSKKSHNFLIYRTPPANSNKIQVPFY